MKKIRKMDEMELMVALKTTRILFLFQTILLFTTIIVDMFKMGFTSALTTTNAYIVEASLGMWFVVEAIYNPTLNKKKKKKNEK